MGQLFPDDWHDISQAIFSTSVVCPRIIVLGKNGVGKSSFIRFLVKKRSDNQSRICRLEADCGQPDFTPPGILNLAMLNCDENPQIVSQRFLGSVTPSVNPIAYVACVESLYRDYQSRFTGTPLIVNLHGWNIGIGKKTYEAVLQVIQPDFVLHIGCSKENPSFPIEPENPFTSTPLPVPSPRWLSLSPVIVQVDDDEGKWISSMLARDKRWVKYASHFRPDLIVRNEFKSGHPRDFFVSPFCRLLLLEKSSIRVTFVAKGIDPQEPFKNIEKLLVGLCNSGSGQCVCLGFVDSFDDKRLFVLIPPNIPKRLTDSVDEIVRGEMSWSPREQVCYKGKTTSTDLTDEAGGEPYFLTNALVDDDFAKTASTRTNLARKRLRNDA